MIVIIIALVAAAAFLYAYYEGERKYWRRRGIPGPPPRLLWGNLKEVMNYDTPRVIALRDWTKQYGKVYGYHEGQRKILVISDFRMVEEILTKQFDCFHGRAKFPMQGQRQTADTTIVEAWGAQWKRLRALSSPAFTNNALKQLLPTVDNSAQTMLGFLNKAAYGQNEVNMIDFFNEYTLNIISKLALGQKEAKLFENPFMEGVKGVFSMPFSSPVNVVPCLFPAIAGGWREMLMAIGDLAGVAYHVLLKELRGHIALRKKEREANQPSTGDVIDILLDSVVDEKEIVYDEASGYKDAISRKLSFDEVASLCQIFLLAGFDTTANTLSFATYVLANNADLQEQLHDEVAAICPDDEITFEQLGQLKFTEAFVKETLRHFPLASFATTRECMRTTSVAGMTIEKGTSIYVDTWSIHMDEDIWGKDAADFRPERYLHIYSTYFMKKTICLIWLDDARRVPRAAFLAFGEGPRMCIGARLGMIEMKMALARLAKDFVVAPCEKTNPLKLLGSLTVTPASVIVRVEKRR